MEHTMHAVVRTYSGKGAKELIDLVTQSKPDVERLIAGIQGFVGPHLLRALSARGARVCGCGPEDAAPGLALDAWVTADVRDQRLQHFLGHRRTRTALGARRFRGHVDVLGLGSCSVEFHRAGHFASRRGVHHFSGWSARRRSSIIG
jgi:hypothetical protein